MNSNRLQLIAFAGAHCTSEVQKLGIQANDPGAGDRVRSFRPLELFSCSQNTHTTTLVITLAAKPRHGALEAF